MGDKNKPTIMATLAAATCSLLGSNMPEPVQAKEEPRWDFDTALLYYAEDDDRVQDISLNILARRTFVDDRLLTLGVTIDGLTGASPNGALPQDVPQTFTRPSGASTYATAPARLPIDDTFRDTRLALSASWQQPLGRLYQVNAGASASKEFDYLHLGLNARISRDFNRRNTTISTGIAIARDEWDPIGGTPAALTQMLNERDLSNRGGTETKNILDLVFGVTQVISRNLLVQVNYSYSDSSGYLSDPFKIVSVVDGTTGDAVPLAAIPGAAGPSHRYLYENRPRDRVKHSLFTQAKHYLNGKVLDVSYRYMTDDWDIDSHTLDLRYRWSLNNSRYIEPHFRYYSQSAADFYRLSLVDGAALPAFASADHRLGDFDAITAGLKFGWKTGTGNDMNFRLELYQQSGSVAANQLIGNQVGRDNYPNLNAVIVQFGYRFGR